MLKFETIKPRQEDGHYLNCEFDFRSLQIILGMQDAGYQSPIQGDFPLDQISYDIYGKINPKTLKVEEVGHSDAHAATAFGVFYRPINKEIIEIIDDNNKKWLIEDVTPLKIKRKDANGNLVEEEITGRDLDESDIIVDRLAASSKH